MVEKINNSTFACCKKLKSVSLNNQTSIENEAFDRCDHLETINIDATNKPLSVSQRAFLGCTSLHVINIYGSNKVDIENIGMQNGIINVSREYFNKNSKQIASLTSQNNIVNITKPTFNDEDVRLGSKIIQRVKAIKKENSEGRSFFKKLFSRDNDYVAKVENNYEKDVLIKKFFSLSLREIHNSQRKIAESPNSSKKDKDNA
jgi:hypothetical protein